MTSNTHIEYVVPHAVDEGCMGARKSAEVVLNGQQARVRRDAWIAPRFVHSRVVQECIVVWLVGGVPLAEPSWGRATTQVEGRMRLTLMIVTKGRLEGSSPSLRANLLDVALYL